MRIRDYIRPDLTWVIEDQPKRDELLREMTRRIAAAEPSVNAEALYQSLLQREGQRSTATPEGVALPHAMVPGMPRHLVAVALIRAGIDFFGKGCPSSSVVFLLAGPPGFEHVRLLARVARICYGPGALARLRGAESDEQLFERLKAEDQSHG